MSRTTRRKPSSRIWFKRQRHIGHRRADVSARQSLSEIGLIVKNRLKSSSTRIASPNDDKIITHWRGQLWARQCR